MTSFQLEIVTPENVFYKGSVVSLVVPGAQGYLGVLAHHAALVTPLTKGQLTFRLESGEEKQYLIDGGFMEVSNNQALLLVESIHGSAAAIV